MLAFLLPASSKLLRVNHLRLSYRPAAIVPKCVHPPSRPRPITSSAPSHQSIWQVVKSAPCEPGVYRFLAANGEVLYIGKARTISTRLRQYVARDNTTVSGVRPSSNLARRIATMVSEASSVDFIVTQSESAALALEASMVSELKPKYNVLLKDDRRHPYAIITFSDDYPRIFVTRSRNRNNPADRLYGPFVDEARLRQILDCIHAVFPLRQRPRRLFSDRPCINYDLGRCPAPCQKLVSTDDYAKTISKVDKLLKGRVVEVIDEMRTEMQTHSDAMQYEIAAVWRDKIAAIENVFFDGAFSEHQPSHNLQNSFTLDANAAASIVTLDPFVSRDVFGIAQSESIGKVVLFQVRGGKVIARLIFTVEACTDESSTGDVLSAVLSSHYAATRHPMEIPEQVVVSTSISDSAVLKAALSDKRGKSVTIRLAGPSTRAIVAMVEHNAQVEVDLEEQRTSDSIQSVSSLFELVRPYFNDFTVHMDKSSVLRRIEGYDISHTSGSNAIGAQVVFLNGVSVPAEYRRYNISEDSSRRGQPDDYESIRETLRMRFKSTSAYTASMPDLLIIDGGKGQLSAASEALQEMDVQVPIISIAKQDEAIFVEKENNAINFDEGKGGYFMNDGIRLVCRVRDEAHRCAVSAHRRRRGRQELRSGLDGISGLGKMKRAALLEYFNGSSEGVAKASKSELEKATGIGPALAEKIFDHFHE